MNKLPFFHKAHSGNMRFSSGPDSGYVQRFSFFIFIFSLLIFFIILVIRLFQLTIVKGEYYRRLADDNRIRELVIEAKRGKIVDRKGFDIAFNILPNLDGEGPRLLSKRKYLEGEAFSHLIGYRQIADGEDIEKSDCLAQPKTNDKVGKKGVEKVYECDLKGRHGGKLIELDARGDFKKTLSVAAPTEGKTIELAIDMELQKKAYEKMQGKKGAVIVLKPDTGEILALVSTPTYNPQSFEDNNQAMIQSYLKDEDKPLFNRATEATYPPGSIFKLVIAAAALEDKKITEKTIFVDNGKIKAGSLEFGNWYFLQYGKTDGPVDVIKGIKRSNDIFFYRIGDLVGPERIKYWAQKFGFGRKTAIPFDQAEGLIPSPFWKEEIIKDRWYQGDNYNIAIGQGYLLVTPLQVALSTSVFANGGEYCDPKLLKNEPSKCKSLELSEKTQELIREGMRQACAAGGTGWPLFDFRVRQENELLTPRPTPKDEKEATMSANFGSKKIAVGCKTGTSENSASSGLPHAWFTAFAPYDKPELVVTVIVEESGQGSDVAAPIAKEIFKSYFERKE